MGPWKGFIEIESKTLLFSKIRERNQNPKKKQINLCDKTCTIDFTMQKD